MCIILEFFTAVIYIYIYIYIYTYTHTHCMGGWVGPRVGLDGCGNSCPTGIRSPSLPARSELLYRLRYPGPLSLSLSTYIYIYIATRYGLDGPGIESQWGEIFRTRPDRPWDPPSLLYNGYRVFLGSKTAEAWR